MATEKPQIEIIARALIVDEENILLCENIKEKHYFLPGGHLEFGESLKEALAREIEEELGVSGTVQNLIGVLENTYKSEENIHHEVNMIFSAELSTIEVMSQESHIKFHWVKAKDLSSMNLLPSKLPTLISKWLKDGKTFFDSTF